MATINTIRKTPDSNGIYHYVELCNNADYPTTEWVHDPDISAVSGVDKLYWEWNGLTVTEMSATDKALVNQAVTNETSTSDIGGLTTYHNSGRAYCYADDRWVVDGDDNYGIGYYQFAESGLAGVNPVYEWEHQGHLVNKGDTLKRFSLSGRCTSTLVTDMQICVVFRTPTLESRFTSGYDNDGEMTNIEVYRDFFFNPLNNIVSGPAATGNTNDIHRRDISLDFEFPANGFLTIYYKPVNTSTSSTYYFPHTYKFDILVG